MDNYDILQRLRSGMTADELADEFTKALNSSLKLYEEEENARRQEELERQAAKEAAAEKEADTGALLAAFDAYLRKYYGDIYDVEKDIDKIDAEMIDSFIRMFDFMAHPEKFYNLFTW